MSKTSKEDVLVNTPIEETVAKTAEVLYGADGDDENYEENFERAMRWQNTIR